MVALSRTVLHQVTSSEYAVHINIQTINQLIAQGRLSEAIRGCHALLQAQPSDAGLWELLAGIQHRCGDPSGAEQAYKKALNVDPRRITALHGLSVLSEARGDLAAAARFCSMALQVNPGHPVLHYNLGSYLNRLGNHEEALIEFQTASRLKPDFAEAYNNAGIVLAVMRRVDEAVACYRKAVALRPDFVDAWNNMGVLMTQAGRLADAVQSHQRALKIQQQSADTHDKLASALSFQGRLDEALLHYRKALLLAPDDAQIGSNYLLCLGYHPDTTPAALFDAHKAWGIRQTERYRGFPKPTFELCDKSSLHIGYVSADFYNHSVAQFLHPVVKRHRLGPHRVSLYSDTQTLDATSADLKSMVDQWRDIRGLGHEQVVERVRSDGVDILIDLSGHTGGNRLPVFAMRAAPVQMTWLGYPATSGLASMDYRITDAMADPQGQEAFHTENLLWMPGCFLCYEPPHGVGDVSPSPLRVKGHVTFGSFNHLPKIQPLTIEAWSRILHGVPGSRLVMKNRSFRDEAAKEKYTALFDGFGISADRLDMIGWMPSSSQHLRLYDQVDIALDTYPYNGTTTTCEALWMGVPVVTLAGDRHAGRVGADILSVIDQPGLVANDVDAYVDISIALAHDPDRLSMLRSTLRERVRASVLVDDERFTRDLEEVYMSAWKALCQSDTRA